MLIAHSPMFTFGFEEAPPAPDQPAAPTGDAPVRRAREHAPSELRADAAQWPVERVEVEDGQMEDHHRTVLLKSTPPEASVPELLCEELAGDDHARDSGGAASGAEGAATSLAGSDLVPAVYEGGFKVWECAHDLMATLFQLHVSGEIRIDGRAVLEAGCGAGLPAVLCMRLGAARAVLQDYNAAVLTALTMQTVKLNQLWTLAQCGRIRFISGDWERVSELLLSEREKSAGNEGASEGAASDGGCGGSILCGGGRASPPRGYDIILTADTIYSPAASRRLWELIRAQLAKGGVAYVAAKSYYFGVGGSVSQFKEMVAADRRFGMKTVRVFDDGASNRREVFSIYRYRSTLAARGPV